MKVLILIALLAVVCVILFVTGVFSPKRSRRLERSVDRFADKGTTKGDRNAGRFGDASKGMVKRMRRAADASAKAGRDVHDRMTS